MWESFKDSAVGSKAYRDMVARTATTGEAFRLYRQTRGRWEAVGVIHYACYRKVFDARKRETARQQPRSASVPTAAPSMWCPECEEEVEPEPAYECGNCGAVFSESMSETGSNRCSCGKFASKTTDTACPACGIELESLEGAEGTK